MAVNPFLVPPGRRLLIARRTFSSAITLFEKSANFMASGTESPHPPWLIVIYHLIRVFVRRLFSFVRHLFVVRSSFVRRSFIIRSSFVRSSFVRRSFVAFVVNGDIDDTI